MYSWSEPVTSMPSGYTAPLNTSSTAQTKTGELGASSFRDADDSNYYINPSGNSVVAGTITAANPVENNHVSTKGYVDGLLGNVEQEVSLSNLVYIADKQNPSCLEADSIMIMKHCVSTNTWVSSNVSCDSDAVICVQIEQPLFDKHHTEEQCRIWGGETVIVEEDVKICKMNSASCPGGWTQYKNWSTTLPTTAPMTIVRVEPSGTSTYTGSHNWSNTPQESFFCFYGDWAYCKRNECAIGYNYGCGGFNVYANMTQIGCY
ncbi:MAG: hypothetical protein PHV65_05960 [Bacteroidales bacterium]|nr:hypothetical protein [Bacteroidales bacterium]